MTKLFSKIIKITTINKLTNFTRLTTINKLTKLNNPPNHKNNSLLFNALWARKVFVASVLAVACFFVLSCASSPKFSQRKFDAAFANADYSTCAELIRTKDKKGTKIDVCLDAAMLEHIALDYEASLNTFNYTSFLIDEAFTKSISKQMAGALFNPNLADYTGNIYEYLFVNTFNALNYYNVGNTEEALVEVRKLAVKLREYVIAYGDAVRTDAAKGVDFTDAKSSMKGAGVNFEEIIGHAPKKATSADIYSDSAFTRYVCLKLYAIAGDVNAAVDARHLARLNSNFSEAEIKELEVPKGLGRLDVLAMPGQIVKREAGYLNISVPLTIFTPKLGMCVASFYFMTGSLIPPAFGLHFTYPKVGTQNSTLDVQSVVATKLDGEDAGEDYVIQLSLLEDFDKAVSMDVATKANKAFGASIARSTTKKVLALGAAEAALQGISRADEDSGTVAQLALMLAMPAIQRALEAIDESEAPDLRGCAFFPRKALAGGLNIPPGTYRVTITYTNGATDIKENVAIKEEKITLVESLRLK